MKLLLNQNKLIRKILEKFFVFVSVLILLSSQNLPLVFAQLTPNQLRSLNSGARYHNTEEGCAVSGNTPGGAAIPEGTPDEKLKAFVDTYGKFAYDNSITSGVPYDFTLAQAIVEGGYDSTLAAKYNNFFGTKAGKSWTGATVSLPTREVINGADVYVMAEWRVYSTPLESFADHDKFLRENSRYAKAFNYSNDSIQFLTEIRAAGYATDPNYVSIVGGVIKKIQKYVEEAGLFPPSSEVVYKVDATTLPVSGGPKITPSGCVGGTSLGSIGELECPTENWETLQVGSTTYYKIPDAPGGEYSINASQRRRFGHKELVCVIYTVSKAYAVKYQGKSKVDVGDLNGGSPHKSHKWGVAVDLDAPGTTYAADHTKGGYSSEATVDLGKLFVDTGFIKNIWWCQPGGDDSTEQIIAYAKSIGKPLNSMKCITGHTNHFHIDINVAKGDVYTP